MNHHAVKFFMLKRIIFLIIYLQSTSIRDLDKREILKILIEIHFICLIKINAKLQCTVATFVPTLVLSVFNLNILKRLIQFVIIP